MRGAMPVETGIPDRLAGKIVHELRERGLQDDPVGIDMADLVTIEALTRAGLHVTDGSRPMLEARKIKSAEEVALLDHACGMVDAVYEEIYTLLRPGVHEHKIVARAQEILFELGSEQVEAINAVSGDRCNPHPHVFSDRLLRPGDQAFFDVIHSFMGYRTCYYRTFNVGGISQAQLDAYKQCREWLDASIELVRPGTTTDEIAAGLADRRRSSASRTRRAASGSSSGTASASGLYEPPMISRVHSLDCPMELEEGMVFALETYCAATDGRSAARIEEELVVTKDGNRVLTRFPAEELLVAGKSYVRGADLLERDTRRSHDAISPGPDGRRSSSCPRLRRRASSGAHAAACWSAATPARRTPGSSPSSSRTGTSTRICTRTSRASSSSRASPCCTLDGHSVRLAPEACGAIPVGVPHAWRSEGHARWVEMASPRPRPADQPPDTFFLGPPPDDEPSQLDLRDPRNRNLFHLSASDMDVQALESRLTRRGADRLGEHGDGGARSTAASR